MTGLWVWGYTMCDFRKIIYALLPFMTWEVKRRVEKKHQLVAKQSPTQGLLKTRDTPNSTSKAERARWHYRKWLLVPYHSVVWIPEQLFTSQQEKLTECWEEAIHYWEQMMLDRTGWLAYMTSHLPLHTVIKQQFTYTLPVFKPLVSD